METLHRARRATERIPANDEGRRANGALPNTQMQNEQQNCGPGRVVDQEESQATQQAQLIGRPGPDASTAGSAGTGATIVAEATRAAVRARSTVSEAQRERILTMLRTGEKSTLDFRSAGVMQSGTRVFELRARGHCILTAARRTMYDADGYAHRGVAIYALVGEPAGGEDDRPTPVGESGRTQRNMLRRSRGANAQNGLRRTIADKRNAVQIALADPEWSKLSDRDIAKLCDVSNTFVGNVRRENEAPLVQPVRTVSTHEAAAVGGAK